LDIVWIAIFSVSTWRADMTSKVTTTATMELKQQERREFRSYVWAWPSAAADRGAVCAGSLGRHSALSLADRHRAFALVQMLVHFRFFLHIGFKQKRETCS